MFTDDSALKYLVNKPVLGGNICRQLLLFQEFDFEIIVKLGRLNASLDHLSRIQTGKEPTNIEDGILNAQLFLVHMEYGHYSPIIQFLATGVALE